MANRDENGQDVLPTQAQYGASVTVSGLTLPTGRPLMLVGGIVIRNAAANITLNGEALANVVPAGQTGPYLHRISRYILVSQFEAKPPLELWRVNAYLEKVALPLRLGTVGSILVDSLKCGPGNLDEFLSKGRDQPAPELYGHNTHVNLDEAACKWIERSLAQLVYQPRYELSLVHYIESYYAGSPSEACLKYLLTLETLFDPNGQQRGQANRVAGRASTFAATSVAQKRQMRNDVAVAYSHRATLRHGETRPEKLQAAREWFSTNATSLQTITAWAIQRVLRLSVESDSFDLPTYVARIERGDREAAERLMQLPLCWVDSARDYLMLDPRLFTVSPGASVELVPQPPRLEE